MATAGRTVAFSAATVAAALITLIVFPQDFLKPMGIAGAIVAVVAALASLVISPALFAIWGDLLARGAAATPRPRARRWHRLAHAVMRRARLIAPSPRGDARASPPALTVTWSAIDSTVIPEDKSARTVADAVNRGEAAKSPMVMVSRGAARRAADVQAFADRVAGVDGVEGVAPPRDLGSGTWQVSASPPATRRAGRPGRRRGDPRDPAPFDVRVGGGAAEFVDQQAAIGSRLLAVALLVADARLLWLMTGSVVLPSRPC